MIQWPHAGGVLSRDDFFRDFFSRQMLPIYRENAMFLIHTLENYAL
jgi:hypothetical protein